MKQIVDVTLLPALREAGLADENTRRVVIDLQCGHVPIVHIERIGDDKLLNVVQTLAGVDITWVYRDSEPEVDGG